MNKVEAVAKHLKRIYKDKSIHNQGSTKCYHKNGCHLVVKNKEVSGRVFSFLKQTTGGQGWVQWEAERILFGQIVILSKNSKRYAKHEI